jgi:hypothetical protein
MKIDIAQAHKLYKEYKALVQSIESLKNQIQEAFEQDKTFCITIQEKEPYRAPNELGDTIAFRFSEILHDSIKAKEDTIFKEDLESVDAALLLTYVLELKQRRLKYVKNQINEMGLEC